MAKEHEFLDDAGHAVLRFISAARNLSRVGELTDEIIEIAKSGAWRRYKTATGINQWRECELDYFLIASDLEYGDVSRVLAYTREGVALAPMMDREAERPQRRSLEEASDSWQSPGAETLLDRARRLGWTKSGASTDLRVAPLPPRARARQAHGMSWDERAKQTRASRIPARRRRELDALARQLRDSFHDETERRYLIDRLAATARRTTPSS